MGDSLAHDEFFRASGEWTDHWEVSYAPSEWEMTPATAFERAEFWAVFDGCLASLPDRMAQAFTLRELDGQSSEEICEVLNVSTNNLWVMLHRARLHLRRCIELNWFRAEAAKP
jgi:RNA polymerase sigma-70 factor (ECF subfamily)